MQDATPNLPARSPWCVERFTRSHRRLADSFVSGSPPLDQYLRRFAIPHEERDHIARTWILRESQTADRLMGYFSLATTMLSRERVGHLPALARLPSFPIPGILLARFAVHEELHGQGVGSWMFDEVVRLLLTFAAEGPIGFRVLVTDAKDERALRFYSVRGCEPLGEERWPRPMVFDLAPGLPKR